MVRQTDNLGLEAPEHGDSDFWETFDALIDAFDELTVLPGLLANRPPAGEGGRLYLTPDDDPDESVATLYYDTGSEWISPATYGNPPEELLRRDQDEVVEGVWNFHETLHAHISGRASEADEADVAETANDADRLGGDRADDYARTDSQETFEETVTHDAPVEMADGARVNGGTVDLPQYSGGDPASFELGSFWVRLDRQP